MPSHIALSYFSVIREIPQAGRLAPGNVSRQEKAVKTATFTEARTLSFQLPGDGQNTPIGFKDALMQF